MVVRMRIGATVMYIQLQRSMLLLVKVVMSRTRLTWCAPLQDHHGEADAQRPKEGNGVAIPPGAKAALSDTAGSAPSTTTGILGALCCTHLAILSQHCAIRLLEKHCSTPLNTYSQQ